MIDAIHAFVAAVDRARDSVVEDRRRTCRAGADAADFDAVAEQAIGALGWQRALAPRAVVLAAVAVDGVAIVADLAGIRVAVPAARGGGVYGAIAGGVNGGVNVGVTRTVRAGVDLAAAVGTGVRLLRVSGALVRVVAAGGDHEHAHHTQADNSAEAHWCESTPTAANLSARTN